VYWLNPGHASTIAQIVPDGDAISTGSFVFIGLYLAYVMLSPTDRSYFFARFDEMITPLETVAILFR
jgi:hypothetical protein